MDLKPCNNMVAYVGQDMFCFTVRGRCRTPSTDTLLNVSKHDGTALAVYPVHGIDSDGMCFYVDSTINAIAGNYRYSITTCGRVVSEGTMVVMPSRENYQPQAPNTRCKCEGC